MARTNTGASYAGVVLGAERKGVCAGRTGPSYGAWTADTLRAGSQHKPLNSEGAAG